MGQDLVGGVAVVTGAAGGIGSACARALATAGAAVMVTDIDLAAAEQVADAIRSAGGTACAARLDVSDEAQWRSLVIETGDRYGAITVLHSNAALTGAAIQSRDNSVLDMDVDLWDAVMAVNVRGAMLGCKHTIPGMIERGRGSIIITTSVAASLASLRTAYTTSKGALVSLMRSVATAHGPHGIRCNAIAPGFIETDATALLSDRQRADLTDANRVPYPGQAGDIAALVRFLASEEARFITGQVVVADGGMSIHLPNIRRSAERATSG